METQVLMLAHFVLLPDVISLKVVYPLPTDSAILILFCTVKALMKAAFVMEKNDAYNRMKVNISV